MKNLPCILIAALAVAAACDSSNTHLTGTPDADSSAEADATADAEADADPDAACDPACAPGFVCIDGACVLVAADADADADVEADATADAEADADPDADAGPDCLASCADDPPAGSAGAPCESAGDCAAGFECFPEQASVFDGELYVYWAGGYCASYGAGSTACSPYDPRTCPSGSECIYMGAGLGGDAYGCMDRCAAASREDVPWNDNCDCRDGYACDLSSELCLSGCSNDRECCEIWDDRNGNGIRNTGEVTLLGPDECTDVCDPCSFTCTLDGCPGGACAMGGPCEHDSDCPADSQCWIDPGIPGGMCVRVRCDLVGRECPAGSGCADLGGGGSPYYACMTPCTPGTQPGDAGYPCRDVGPAGPSAGDFACQPIDSGSWYDATDAGGYCSAGVFPGGDGPIGSPCTANDDCLSPFGLGLCADWEDPSWCTVTCSEESAADGVCEIDPAATSATGACYYQICVAACDTPAGPLGANGCSNPDLACYDSRPFSPYLYLADGRTRPPGICYAACTSDAECVASWGAGYACDDASGTCQP